MLDTMDPMTLQGTMYRDNVCVVLSDTYMSHRDHGRSSNVRTFFGASKISMIATILKRTPNCESCGPVRFVVVKRAVIAQSSGRATDGNVGVGCTKTGA